MSGVGRGRGRGGWWSDNASASQENQSGVNPVGIGYIPCETKPGRGRGRGRGGWWSDNASASQENQGGVNPVGIGYTPCETKPGRGRQSGSLDDGDSATVDKDDFISAFIKLKGEAVYRSIHQGSASIEGQFRELQLTNNDGDANRNRDQSVRLETFATDQINRDCDARHNEAFSEQPRRQNWTNVGIRDRSKIELTRRNSGNNASSSSGASIRTTSNNQSGQSLRPALFIRRPLHPNIASPPDSNCADSEQKAGTTSRHQQWQRQNNEINSHSHKFQYGENQPQSGGSYQRKKLGTFYKSSVSNNFHDKQQKEKAIEPLKRISLASISREVSGTAHIGVEGFETFSKRPTPAAPQGLNTFEEYFAGLCITPPEKKRGIDCLEPLPVGVPTKVELLAVAGHFCLFVQTTDQKFKLKNMIQELEKWNLQPCQTIQKGLYVVVRYGSELCRAQIVDFDSQPFTCRVRLVDIGRVIVLRNREELLQLPSKLYGTQRLVCSMSLSNVKSKAGVGDGIIEYLNKHIASKTVSVTVTHALECQREHYFGVVQFEGGKLCEYLLQNGQADPCDLQDRAIWRSLVPVVKPGFET